MSTVKTSTVKKRITRNSSIQAPTTTIQLPKTRTKEIK